MVRRDIDDGASGIYVFVYLYRWEWHRALLVGILFVGAEIAVASVAILKRIRHLRDLSTPHEPLDQELVLARLQAARPKREPFAWLVGNDRQSVFLPILLGSGVLISGVAWVLEKVAARTVEPGLERRLAGSLQRLSFPREPLVPGEAQTVHEACGDERGMFLPCGDRR